jgi:hypothetical protein
LRILREDNRNIGGMESMELRNVGIRGGIRISEGERKGRSLKRHFVVCSYDKIG